MKTYISEVLYKTFCFIHPNTKPKIYTLTLKTQKFKYEMRERWWICKCGATEMRKSWENEQ